MTSGGSRRLHRWIATDLFENSPIAYLVINRDGRIAMANRAAGALLRGSSDELVGHHVFDLYGDGPQGREKATTLMARFLEGIPILGEELEYRALDGAGIWGRLWVAPVKDETGRVVASRSMVVDVTAQHRAEAALRMNEQRLRAVLLDAPIAVCETDRDGVCLYSDGFALRTLGRVAGDVVGRSMLDLCVDNQPVADCVARALRGETGATSVQVGNSTFHVYFRPRRSPTGEPDGALGVAVDITDRVWAEQALMRRVQYDRLTGLPLRPLFVERVRSAIDTEDARTFAVAVIEITGLSPINSTFGHKFGDQVVRRVSQLLRRQLRGDDVLAHFWGNYFAILVRSVHDVESAQAAVTALGGLFRSPLKIGRRPIIVGIDVGSAAFPAHGRNAEMLLRRAQLALDKARASKAGVRVFRRSMEHPSGAALELLGELPGAIREGQLQLAFMPEVALTGPRFAGFEALVRWNHPVRGLLAPSEFIELAEQSGLICDLTDWVVNATLSRIADWAHRGLNASVSVNVSERDLYDPDFVGRIERAISANQALSENLMIEITERTLIIDPESAIRVCRRLAALGVRVALDDFGTGYSSLANLRDLPIHELKIDRTFVSESGRRTRRNTIVKSMIGLAHSLRLKCTAEGVESEATLQRLRGWGCDFAQGYHVSKPMSALQVPEWLTRLAPGGRTGSVDGAAGAAADYDKLRGAPALARRSKARSAASSTRSSRPSIS